ncbi:MAG: cupredoxin domain-containing protein [Armatimonadota bacterium]|nr:cupredoxin domain-containing protein [Armatimonadota bacterium]MDR7492747.1 cupredoxin domain-containing protein [Armatimonadota bacterium]MDR7504302.1 cupredoxin domain-containing protein [Armatimonadota bacterium]MDR7546801.1 cupredoxin domain-containing protein [Armatimonadota bacterium]MDR7552688.1 cupredoxin domain-containing protein [Armatimonadota bacterium]
MALIGVLLILVALAGFGAMGGWGGGPPVWMPHMGWGQGAPAESAATPIAGADREIVSLVDFGFRPGQIRVRAGGPVNLELVNEGRVRHDLTIPALGFRAVVGPGQRVTAGLAGAQAGDYEVYCSVPGHREAGMVGRLVVIP